jgi:hypothetical protein
MSAAMITVKSIAVANGGTYAVELPAGNYQIVASTYNKTTLKTTTDAVVISGVTATYDFTF